MTGQKHDAGKPRLSLIPYSALKAAAEALEHGAEKYGERNFRDGGMTPERYVDAAMRHLNQHSWEGLTDSDSGLPHLSLALASVIIAIDLEAHSQGVARNPYANRFEMSVAERDYVLTNQKLEKQ